MELTELLEENDIKFIELVAAEFNEEKSSFRAFFSYRNGTKPAFALAIHYYRKPKGGWKSFVSLQEPYNFMLTSVVYEELRKRLQGVANSLMKYYNKGAKIDEETNHIISNNSSDTNV